MLYFILWAVFIVAVIAAVPVAHLLDQRGRSPAEPLIAGSYDQDDPAEATFDDAQYGDAPISQDPIDEGFGNEEIVDDFGAFEDEFK